MQTLGAEIITDKVMEVIKRNAVFNPDKVNRGSDIRRDHGIDSIKMVELVVDLEEEFNIEVDSASLTYENFANAELITAYVIKKQSQG